MNRGTAVRHVTQMAESCEGIGRRTAVLGSATGIESFWVAGDLLDEGVPWRAESTESVRVAACLAVPEDAVPWLGRPDVAGIVEDLAGWRNRPVVVLWRSAAAPVWNHLIERPMLLWDAQGGVRVDAVRALQAGVGMEAHRLDAPSRDQLERRLADEVDTSLRHLRTATEAYDDRRWGRGPHQRYADDLWAAAHGYLDLLAARARLDG